MRNLLLFLIVAFILAPEPLFAEEWFDVEIRIMTTGENQPQREIGIFGAELPLSGKGYLEKSLAIKNSTRNTSNVVDFKISMKPERGERGDLHLMFTSDATPRSGKTESRFRDLIFERPSGQIVEIFNDPETGTHILVALLLKIKEVGKEMTSDLRVILKSRVERISGAGREQIDSFDLQSVGNAPVGRTLTHSVPVWVPGEAGEIKIEGLKDLDKATSIMTVKPGEGFSYTPQVSKSEARAKEKEKKKKAKDNRIPMMYQRDKDEEEPQAEGSPPAAKDEAAPKSEPEPEAPSGSYAWEKENFSFDVTCEAEPGGTVKATVKMSGSFFDQEKKNLVVLKEMEESRSFANGDIAVFTLSDEPASGYILTIQAQF